MFAGPGKRVGISSQKVRGNCCYLATVGPGLRRALTTAVAIEPTIRQNSSAFVQKAI